ncbi:HAD family hydrolase [Pontivivens ytuae]|uniref:HAD family hydrolase n=1 Tax=Pontivivens ytuae TaxID=2789856 RepID=A0A7S9LTE1_9RHOB|nr:HAD family hydrolase [Pontivivens ytuae]QPH54784.1 HAD family hydrolase [Pontivivens ytuae]
MTPELVIFDCDGVLIDSEIIACAVDAEELNKEGYEISVADVVRRFAGMPGVAMRETVESDLGRSLPADYDQRIEDRVLAAYRTQLKAIAGAAETIATLPWRYCVASSSRPTKLCLGLIETAQFELFYPHVFSTSLVPRGKPAPDIFLYAAQRMQVTPERCLVVEDSVAGVRAGRAAGMQVVGFTGGSHCDDNHATRLHEHGAHAVIDRFDDFLPAVERLAA